MVERDLDVIEVRGSIPLPPTNKSALGRFFVGGKSAIADVRDRTAEQTKSKLSRVWLRAGAQPESERRRGREAREIPLYRPLFNILTSHNKGLPLLLEGA